MRVVQQAIASTTCFLPESRCGLKAFMPCPTSWGVSLRRKWSAAEISFLELNDEFSNAWKLRWANRCLREVGGGRRFESPYGRTDPRRLGSRVLFASGLTLKRSCREGKSPLRESGESECGRGLRLPQHAVRGFRVSGFVTQAWGFNRRSRAGAACADDPAVGRKAEEPE